MRHVDDAVMLLSIQEMMRSNAEIIEEQDLCRKCAYSSLIMSMCATMEYNGLLTSEESAAFSQDMNQILNPKTVH